MNVNWKKQKTPRRAFYNFYKKLKLESCHLVCAIFIARTDPWGLQDRLLRITNLYEYTNA